MLPSWRSACTRAHHPTRTQQLQTTAHSTKARGGGWFLRIAGVSPPVGGYYGPIPVMTGATLGGPSVYALWSRPTLNNYISWSNYLATTSGTMCRAKVRVLGLQCGNFESLDDKRAQQLQVGLGEGCEQTDWMNEKRASETGKLSARVRFRVPRPRLLRAASCDHS